MRLFIALTTFAALAACTPTGGGGYTDTPVAQAEGDFPGPSAQTRNRPLDVPAGE
jgi:hypothetical protein